MKNDYAFFDAIRANDLETVKSMLAADPALINTPAPKKPADTRGMSPLQAALCTGWHRDIAWFLLELGAACSWRPWRRQAVCAPSETRRRAGSTPTVPSRRRCATISAAFSDC